MCIQCIFIHFYIMVSKENSNFKASVSESDKTNTKQGLDSGSSRNSPGLVVRMQHHTKFQNKLWPLPKQVCATGSLYKVAQNHSKCQAGCSSPASQISQLPSASSTRLDKLQSSLYLQSSVKIFFSLLPKCWSKINTRQVNFLAVKIQNTPVNNHGKWVLVRATITNGLN